MKKIILSIHQHYSLALIGCSVVSMLPLLLELSTRMIGGLSFYILLLSFALPRAYMNIRIPLLLLGTLIAATHGWAATLDIVLYSMSYQSGLLIYAFLSCVFAIQLCVLLCSTWLAKAVSPVVFERSVLAVLLAALVHIPVSGAVVLVYYVPLLVVVMYTSSKKNNCL